jgi:hypothetical protein
MPTWTKAVCPLSYPPLSGSGPSFWLLIDWAEKLVWSVYQDSRVLFPRFFNTFLFHSILSRWDFKDHFFLTFDNYIIFKSIVSFLWYYTSLSDNISGYWLYNRARKLVNCKKRIQIGNIGQVLTYHPPVPPQ